jgi:hypothetical protein
VTALKLGSQPHYEKEVTEKALALMEKAETVRIRRACASGPRLNGVSSNSRVYVLSSWWCRTWTWLISRARSSCSGLC